VAPANNSGDRCLDQRFGGLCRGFTASRFPRMPAVEYAPSINMSNWLLSTSG
jgi:hypothetical protein